MSTKNFFFAASLLLSTLMSSFCFTSCDNDHDDDNTLSSIPATTTETKTDNKNVYCNVMFNDDTKDLFDVKISFKYDDQTIEKSIDDCTFEKNDSLVITFYKSSTVYQYKQYVINNPLNKAPKNITVSATVKSNYQTLLDQMPENKKITFFFDAKCPNVTHAFASDTRSNKFTLSKDNFHEMMQKKSSYTAYSIDL